MSIDGKEVYTSGAAGDHENDPLWRLPEPFKCPAHPSSFVKFAVCRDGKVRGKQVLGEFEAPLHIFLGRYDERHKLASGDSPDSRIAVRMNADLDCNYLSHGLEAAKRRLSSAENQRNAADFLRAVVESIQMLGDLGEHLASAHPILKFATVLLAAVYNTLTAHARVDEEIKSLARAMRDLLNDANKYKGSKQTESCIQNIILLVMESASLMDKWSRTSFIRGSLQVHVFLRTHPSTVKPSCAHDFLTRVKKCKSQLCALRATFEVVKNLGELDNDVNQIGVKMDGHYTDISAQLTQIMSCLNQMRSEDCRQVAKSMTVGLAVYKQGVPVTVV
ncbi:uncharacterized protein PHACADRAFT_186125 [Phanerochaete carnosa HHB-10118-sp]|uniref:Fungal STAND N-terminal Goodbye domain-containing protein n=1 Tax=Phanerochaete carnosa (strain HHB-10118-sp) TaxID=650164 RepID=K5W3F8_PHACS|nr:uncharacterized protein PHACADRAFT_186125 [Phanerochaete carnosa HHB-10118-sp]EKM53454.1 hypothetical protein PHACADRAFT_186125 [Phanerochaete carnosa HHB-10118-sp]